jgi:hypothetical protein
MVRLFNGDGIFGADYHTVIAAKTCPVLLIMRFLVRAHLPGAEEPALLESYQEVRNSTPVMVKMNKPGTPKPGLFKKGDEMKRKHHPI